MAASTARAYRDSDQGKSSNFSLPASVQASSWPPAYRLLLLEMLQKNRFGTELYRSTRNLSISIGVSYSTVKRMLDRLENGHTFGKKNLVRCDGVLELVFDANSRPNGKLRRQRTYRLRPHNLRARPTEHDFEESSRGAVCPLPPRPERPIPPAPAPQPAAEPQHRSSRRDPEPQPKLTRREATKFVADVATFMRGSNGLLPGSGRVSSPMKFREALEAACELWKRTPESVHEALKFWGYKFEDSDSGEESSP